VLLLKCYCFAFYEKCAVSLKDCYLQTPSSITSENRDKKSAEKFFKKALKADHNQMPRVITTDKYFTYEILINELIYSGKLSCNTQHRQIKYLNNIVKQDHRFIKRIVKPMLGFKSFKSACSTISGIETMRMLRKN